eukprot:2288027-Rhodomonas_salina.3
MKTCTLALTFPIVHPIAYAFARSRSTTPSAACPHIPHQLRVSDTAPPTAAIIRTCRCASSIPPTTQRRRLASASRVQCITSMPAPAI